MRIGGKTLEETEVERNLKETAKMEEEFDIEGTKRV